MNTIADQEAEAAWERLLATYDSDDEGAAPALVADLAYPESWVTVSPPLTGNMAPQLPQSVYQSLKKNPNADQPSISIFGPLLTRVVGLAQDARESGDPDPLIRKISDAFLKQTKKLHVSKEALGQMLRIDPVSLEPSLSLLTSSLVQCDRLRRRSLEETAVHSGCQLLCYLDLNKFDETPMKLHLKHTIALGSGQTPAVLGGHHDPGRGQDPASSQTLEGGITMKATAKGKIFAVENKFGLLLKLPEEHFLEGRHQHLAVIGTSLTWLQLLQRTTGALTKKALQLSSGRSPSSNAFDIKARVSTSDAAPSNDIAEQGILADLGPQWCNVHFHCNAHKIAAVHNHSYSQIQEHLSGAVNVSLSLSDGSSMLAFRESLAEVVKERLWVRRGYPPAEDTLLRKWLLGLFCRSGRQHTVKAFLLESLPNGNWLNTDFVEVWVEPGLVFDASALSNQIVKGLLIALSGRIFTTYNSSKWLGCDVAIDEIGLAQAVHGLAAAAFRRMLGNRRTRPLSREAPQSIAEHPIQEEGAAPGPLSFAGEAAGTDDTPEAVPASSEGLGLGEGGGTSLDPAQLSPQKWSELSNQRQQIALKWLEGNPLAHLMLVRATLSPMANLLRTYIGRSGQRWIQKQRAAMAQKLQGQLPAMTQPPLPSMMEYVTQSAEKVFYVEWESLLQVDFWSHFPDSTKELSFQSLAFRLLSKMGGMVHQLLVAPSKAFPAKLFFLLHDHSQAKDILDSRECLRDLFTQKFIERFGACGLDSPDALAVLNLVVMTSSPETVSTEWGHSRVHRILTGAAQVQKPSMEYLNSQVVSMQHRRRMNVFEPAAGGRKAAGPRVQQAEEEAAGEEDQEARRGGGGGAWRAFCSMRRRGRARASGFEDLAEEYREAKRQRSAEYLQAEEIGRAATERHRDMGLPSFGPPPRTVRRSQTRLQPGTSLVSEQGALRPTAAMQVGEQPARLTFQDLDLDTALTKVRKEAMRVGRAKASAERASMRALQKFQEEHTGALHEACLAAMPDAAPFISDFKMIPHESLMVAEVALDPVDDAECVAEWASANARRSNLKAALLADWESKCTTIGESACESTERQPDLHTMCLKYNCCVCSQPGKSYWQFRNRLLAGMKRLIPRADGSIKKRLVDGHFALRLSGEAAPELLDDWDRALEAKYGDSDEEARGSVVGDIWYHIAVHYLKPYRPTLQSLRLTRHEADAGRVFLEQTGAFFTDLEALRTLSLSARWSMEVYEMINTAEPVGTLNPREACFRRKEEEAASLWPPPPRRRRGVARASRARPGVAEAATEIGQAPAGNPNAMDETAEAEAQSNQGNQEIADMRDEAEAVSDSDVSDMDDDIQEALDTALADLVHPHDEGDAADVANFGLDAMELDVEGGRLGAHIVPEDGALEAEDEAAVDVAGGAASSNMPPPPPPPRLERAESVASSQRERAEIVVEVPGGKLTYYHKGEFFTATCNNLAHGKCILTRTSRAGKRSAQGRPLGLLMGWLALGQDSDSKAAHFDRSRWPNHQARTDARERLSEMPGAEGLFAEERPQEPGEVGEPDQLP